MMKSIQKAMVTGMAVLVIAVNAADRKSVDKKMISEYCDKRMDELPVTSLRSRRAAWEVLQTALPVSVPSECCNDSLQGKSDRHIFTSRSSLSRSGRSQESSRQSREAPRSNRTISIDRSEPEIISENAAIRRRREKIAELEETQRKLQEEKKVERAQTVEKAKASNKATKHLYKRPNEANPIKPSANVTPEKSSTPTRSRPRTKNSRSRASMRSNRTISSEPEISSEEAAISRRREKIAELEKRFSGSTCTSRSSRSRRSGGRKPRAFSPRQTNRQSRPRVVTSRIPTGKSAGRTCSTSDK